VNRPRHDVDAVGADIGSNLNFPNDDCFFGKNTAAARVTHRHGLWHTSRHLYAPNTWLTTGLASFFENVVKHVDDFAGIRAFQLNELTHSLRRRHVYLFNHPSKLPNN